MSDDNAAMTPEEQALRTWQETRSYDPDDDEWGYLDKVEAVAFKAGYQEGAKRAVILLRRELCGPCQEWIRSWILKDDAQRAGSRDGDAPVI